MSLDKLLFIVRTNCVIVQTPLIRDPSAHWRGFYTQLFVYLARMENKRGSPRVPALEVVRATVRITNSKGPPKRKLKGQPWTVDRLVMHRQDNELVGVRRITARGYGAVKWEAGLVEYSIPATPWSLDQIDSLYALTSGCKERRMGEPIVDWLRENRNDAAELIQEPGWLEPNQARFMRRHDNFHIAKTDEEIGRSVRFDFKTGNLVPIEGGE